MLILLKGDSWLRGEFLEEYNYFWVNGMEEVKETRGHQDLLHKQPSIIFLLKSWALFPFFLSLFWLLITSLAFHFLSYLLCILLSIDSVVDRRKLKNQGEGRHLLNMINALRKKNCKIRDKSEDQGIYRIEIKLLGVQERFLCN